MKIAETLTQTKASTFAVTLPNPKQDMFPTPVGTGFFVSSDGWFITAAHVLMSFRDEGDDPADEIILQKEVRYDEPGPPVSKLVSGVKLEHYDGTNDFALLKADFAENKEKAWLKERTGFPFVSIGTTVLSDSNDVYAFGYPLSLTDVNTDNPSVKIGTTELKPRVTSAIVSSAQESSGMVVHAGPQQTYVLDKALNYGNSGGPIVAVDTGFVHAFCSRFQPVGIRQKHLGDGITIFIPSLYGIVTSLSYPPIWNVLAEKNVVESR